MTSKLFKKFIMLGVLLALLAPLNAMSTDEVAVVGDVAPVPESKVNTTKQQLVELITTIESAQKELADTKTALSKTKDELDTKALIRQRDKLSARIQDLQRNFEAIATGGVDLDAFEESQKLAKFDWQEELKEVFRPILNEMKRLTERPRAIEKLRTEKTVLTSQLPITVNALEKIKELKKEAESPVLIAHLETLKQSWDKRHDDVSNQLRLVTFQLEEKLNPTDAADVSITDQVRAFFSGRGLNIIFAIIAFVVVYLFFKVSAKVFVHFLGNKKDKETRLFGKAMQIAFRALAVLLSVFSVIIVFYIQGDWFLLGLSLLFLIGFIWTLRQSLPRYITEAKLLLNLGPVRENERVVYNGIPWRVTALNFYTTLTNPALAGGVVQLPAQVVLELQSRRFSKDEPWFPCRPGDFMLLDDGYAGPVMMQTPELVTMKVKGGSTRIYATTDFLGLSPNNLSHGFGVFVTFGFDYADQSIITKEVPEKLCDYIREAMAQEVFQPSLKELKVEFKEAAASSLNVLIITIFEGKAADSYFSIDRFLQRAATDACNHYGWNIPFNQLTVHMAEQETLSENPDQ